MSASKLSLTIFLLLGTWALVAGCGSDPVAPTEDPVPVLPPENLLAMTSVSEKLILSWDPNSHPQLAGYQVYRVEVETQDMAKLTEDAIPGTTYQDLSARRGVEYEYRVTAITTSGEESSYASVSVILSPNQDTNDQDGDGQVEF